MHKPRKSHLFATTALATALATAFVLPAPAPAATANSTIAVSALVLSFCTVVAAPLAFGNYSRVQVDATTTLVVTCTNGTPYTVALDAGIGTGATVASRQMTGVLATSLLEYTLYRDAARTNLWGVTTGTDTVAGTGNGLLQTLTVYGRIPANQAPAPGAYLDTVSVVLTY